MGEIGQDEEKKHLKIKKGKRNINPKKCCCWSRKVGMKIIVYYLFYCDDFVLTIRIIRLKVIKCKLLTNIIWYFLI